MPDASPATTDVRRWLLFFLAFWLLGASWALAVPRAGGPDEPAHVLRAASVVRGQIVTETERDDPRGYPVVEVPELIRALMLMPNGQSGTTDVPGQKPCYASKPRQSAACLPETTTGGSQLVDAPTGAGRYNPVYYALVGWPTLVAPNEAGIVAIRIVSAGLCSALLASAACSMCLARRRGIALAGLLVAVTPTTIFLTGVVNPNALEIAAAISLWAAGLRLVLDPGVDTTALVRRVGVAASLMLLTRSLSPLWLFVVVMTCLAVGKRENLLALIRRRQTWAWSAVIGIAAVAAVGWTLLSGGAEIDARRPRSVGYFRGLQAGIGQFDNRLVQIVGFFGWNDTPAPWPTQVIWGLLFVVLLGVAFRYGQVRQRWILAGLTVVAILGGYFIEASQYHLLGLFWQSRYSLPMIVGVPLLGALVICDRWPTGLAVPSWLVPVAVAATGVAHLLCFGKTLLRFEHGIGASYNPFNGAWTPDVGALTVLLLFVGSMGLSVLAYLRAQRSRPAEDLTV